ncbi:MAG TPA: metallophosphoesterase [Puia sp.]|nr:metallophosphoesterase [Puia sp.]
MKEVNILLTIAWLFISSFVFGQDSAIHDDGPYVFYDAGRIESMQIEKGAVQQKNIDPAGNRMINIFFSAHPDWNFSVSLRKKLSIEPSSCREPKKIFFVSDIEGEFEAFRALLINNEIIDSNYKWIFGDGHLVICGDLFDRGEEVVQELWLLYKLEDDAKAAGGYVHTLLGNHDIMNLSGDTRYVLPFYFANAKAMGKNYMDLYSKSTELGRWLRTKNIVERIGNYLCLHAGISPFINAQGLSVQSINDICRPWYDQGQNDHALDSAHVSPLFDENSPFWYRGYFLEPRASMMAIDSTLDLFDCKKIIVGHTILTINPAMYYQGKVIGIDVNEHEGQRAGVLYQDKKWWVVDGEGIRIPLEYRPTNDSINPHHVH